ncbi:hypothetical protein Bca101_059265 [Brassica carinata]
MANRVFHITLLFCIFLQTQGHESIAAKLVIACIAMMFTGAISLISVHSPCSTRGLKITPRYPIYVFSPK